MFERVKESKLVEAICTSVIIEDETAEVPYKAVCRFYLTNGFLIGEVPAQDIIDFERKAKQAKERQ